MAKKRLVVGNWKMYMDDPREAREFFLGLRKRARGMSGIEVWLAPPYVLIPEAVEVLESSPVEVGAQALSSHADAPHTGEVSGTMLKWAGASFVIVGHSERRASGEGEASVREQLLRAAEAGLAPVLCIGERERGAEGEHFSDIEDQLSSALKNSAKGAMKKLVVAYEPVWAIGKRAEDAMKPQDLQQMVIFIKKTLAELLDRKMALKVPILYGGSVEPANASELVKESGVSGFLVGHASADLEQFLAILQACK
ncbi:MAG TPA: triose-phosphate isomerase [Candidatus Paceibacterota bacterium]|nr:triose-phosphate isomerase [Candidatus Paceibacterota bacterium]